MYSGFPKMVWSKGTFMGGDHGLILQTGVFAAFFPNVHECLSSTRFGSMTLSEMSQLLWFELLVLLLFGILVVGLSLWCLVFNTYYFAMFKAFVLAFQCIRCLFSMFNVK